MDTIVVRRPLALSEVYTAAQREMTARSCATLTPRVRDRTSEKLGRAKKSRFQTPGQGPERVGTGHRPFAFADPLAIACRTL